MKMFSAGVSAFTRASNRKPNPLAAVMIPCSAGESARGSALISCGVFPGADGSLHAVARSRRVPTTAAYLVLMVRSLVSVWSRSGQSLTML
ncbi:MAG: hypothetical protein IPF87_01980 [Gemmatimonadetes bacterium]|nr:hypothetical protein [Gemmatimonadota bacterium]